MAKMIYQAVMHPGNEDPSHDGEFFVIKIDKDKGDRYLTTLEFNFGYGWNTRRHPDGTVMVAHKMELESPFFDYYWLEKGEIYEERY